MSTKNIVIEGDDDIKIELFGKVLYDKDEPFKFTLPLPNTDGTAAHDFGPAEVKVGLSGDTVSVGVAVDGFPVFQKSFEGPAALEDGIPFEFEVLGDKFEGTITLEDAA